MARSRLLASLLLLLTLLEPVSVGAQQPAPTAPPPPPQPAASAPPSGAAAAPPSAAAFTAEQLEQIAAPIALYPDPILAQAMMAATYPLEVVEAARFVKANPNLKGTQLDEKLKDQTWDDSVKSLVYFPQVLALMDEKLDWTQKLGDAVLGQQKEFMDAVQRLRARAQAQGNLKSTSEQNVTMEAAPAAPAPPPPPPAPGQPQQTVVVEQPQQIIKIEPANPQVVYVPSYNPTVVYGAWPYPAYPPYYPYPPGYAFGAAALSFGVGMAVGAAVWGNCNWGGGDVDIDVNKNNNFSRNVNRTDVANKRTERVNQRQSGQGGNRSQWQHNPENRRGVQYRDQATQQKFNRGTSQQAAQSREAFRGRAEQGRQDIGRGGAGNFGGAQGGARSQQFGGGQPGGGRQAGGGQAGQFGAGQAGGGRQPGAFQGMGSGGDARSYSNRGQSSRQSMGASGGGGSRSYSGGGGRTGGGGGARGGGGGRGGGRR
jgi:hypothetical protein